MLQLHCKAMIVCDDESTMELKVGMVKYLKRSKKKRLRTYPQFNTAHFFNF